MTTASQEFELNKARNKAVRTFRSKPPREAGYVMKKDAMDKTVEALRKTMVGDFYVSQEFQERLVFKAIQGNDADVGAPVDKLSDREREVMKLLGEGKSTRGIAEALCLSVKTIETHRTHVKEKLGFKTGDELNTFAMEWLAAGGSMQPPASQ
jgi:DNA-binding NarL/FixJ family response regulator